MSSQPHSTCSESWGLEMMLGFCWMQGALKSNAYSESVWNYTPPLRKRDDPSGMTYLGMTHKVLGKLANFSICPIRERILAKILPGLCQSSLVSTQRGRKIFLERGGRLPTILHFFSKSGSRGTSILLPSGHLLALWEPLGTYSRKPIWG